MKKQKSLTIKDLLINGGFKLERIQDLKGIIVCKCPICNVVDFTVLKKGKEFYLQCHDCGSIISIKRTKENLKKKKTKQKTIKRKTKK